jgi:autophagy-related protein 9
MTEYSLLIDKLGDKNDITGLYLFNLYYYYYNHGYTNLILTEISNLMILSFSVFLIVFVIQCIDITELIKYTNNEPISIGNFIKIHNYWNFNIFITICFVIFVCYLLIQLMSIFASVRKFWKIRKIYKNDLNIDSNELETLTWNEISNKIIKYYCVPNLNIYTLQMQIMIKENLIISIYDQLDKLNFHKYPLTKLLEWNFIFCFINPLINENREININVKTDNDKYINQVKNRLARIAILNLIFMPFVLLFMLLYMILQYGEQFYNKPNLLANRQWTIKALWKFRYYNELPHIFHDRMNKASMVTKDYLKQFPSSILVTSAKLITFILGSFFLLLLILPILNENLLINLNISDGKPVLWYMGILGGIIAISKSFINKNFNNQIEKMLGKMDEHLDLPFEWKENPKSDKVLKQINKMFPQRIILLFEEFYCLIITPYILRFVLYQEVEEICMYLINILIHHHSVNGLVSKNSLFINSRQINENKKTYKSFENFQKNYPEWTTSSFLYHDLGDSLDKSKTYFQQTELNTKLSIITESTHSISQNDDSLINYN